MEPAVKRRVQGERSVCQQVSKGNCHRQNTRTNASASVMEASWDTQPTVPGKRVAQVRTNLSSVSALCHG